MGLRSLFFINRGMKIQAKLMRVLLRLCQHLVEKSRNNPGYYGWVAAAIIAPDGKSAVGLNVPGDSGKRVHAERSAVMNYENRYGPVPTGCVVVTTCSPCAHDEAGTQGESCAELMNQLGVRLVYCGYQDPTPYAHKAKQNYELMVCDNTGLNDLCSLFASTWLKESALPLEESVSQTVYHFSPLYAANEILKQKRFRLTTSLGTKTEKELQPNGTIYYLSTTRSKVGDYTLHSSYKDGVVFKLNGDWLNQNFKGSPVDYWGGMLAPGGFAPNEPVGLKGRYKEMEDRVFSTKPFIDLPSPATKLIQEIHVLLITDKYSHEKMPIYARGVLLNAKRLGIPVWFYDNKEAFILQNKSKSVPITREMAQTLTNPNAEKFGVSHPEWPRRDYFLPWRELYFKNKQSDLSRDADKLRRKVMYPGWDSPDSGLLNDIHHSKKDLPAGLLKLFDIFKKLGIEEPLDYAKYLRDKWEKIGN